MGACPGEGEVAAGGRGLGSPDPIGFGAEEELEVDEGASIAVVCAMLDDPLVEGFLGSLCF